MSAKLLKNLTAAHLNALNSTVASLETQVAALKTVMKELGNSSSKAQVVEEEESEEDEAPKSKKKPAKKAKKEEIEDEDEEEFDESDDEEESSDEDDEEESSDEDDEEESEEDDEPKSKKGNSKGPTKGTVIKALQAYAAENTKAKALKMLAKFKVKSVHDLKPAQYADLIELLS
jgi:hypothetical protein